MLSRALRVLCSCSGLGLDFRRSGWRDEKDIEMCIASILYNVIWEVDSCVVGNVILMYYLSSYEARIKFAKIHLGPATSTGLEPRVAGLGG